MNKNFVIISHQRTGSNMLRKALNHHSEVFCYSELMLEKGGLGEVRLSMDTRKKENFCFLLKYDQITPSVTQFLKDHNFKVIHLKRKNKLKCFVSRMVGSGNNRKFPITLNIEHAKATIKDIYNWEASIDSIFEAMTVFYESIVGIGKVPAGVLRFIDVSYETCNLEDNKLNPDDLSVLLTNYDDVAKAFPEYI